MYLYFLKAQDLAVKLNTILNRIAEHRTTLTNDEIKIVKRIETLLLDNLAICKALLNDYGDLNEEKSKKD